MGNSKIDRLAHLYGLAVRVAWARLRYATRCEAPPLPIYGRELCRPNPHAIPAVAAGRTPSELVLLTAEPLVADADSATTGLGLTHPRQTTATDVLAESGDAWPMPGSSPATRF